MNKIIITALTALTIINSNAFAAPAANDFTVTPRVSFDSGYTTRANHLGLQIQKNSAFVSSSVSLENSIATPTISSTYFIAGENKSQIVVDASLSKPITVGPLTLATVAGVQKRFIDGAFEDTFTAYAGARLTKVPLLSAIATPYVTVSRDFNYELFGTTVGLDRTFNVSSLAITPRVEAYLFDKHTSYVAGGNITYTGMKHLKPYVDVSYVTTDTAFVARKFEGNLAATVGVRMSF